MVMRILAVLILLASVLFLPLWFSAILALIFMGFFNFFIEAVGIFLLSDLLYGAKEERFFNILFVSFLVSLAVFIVIELVKKKIRLSK